MKRFGTTEEITEETLSALSRFVATCYAPAAKTLADARWGLFSKNLTRGPRLPPTRGAFEEHLKRAHAQTFLWKHAHEAIMPKLDLKSGKYGYKWGAEGGSPDEHWIPIPSSILPAPESVNQLISCNCLGTCSRNTCACFKNKLECTALCHARAQNSKCENTDSMEINRASELSDPDYDLSR